jgi:hypothetical protein
MATVQHLPAHKEAKSKVFFDWETSKWDLKCNPLIVAIRRVSPYAEEARRRNLAGQKRLLP